MLTLLGVVGWGRQGKVQLVLQIRLILLLPLQTNFLPETGGQLPVAQEKSTSQGAVLRSCLLNGVRSVVTSGQEQEGPPWQGPDGLLTVY